MSVPFFGFFATLEAQFVTQYTSFLVPEFRRMKKAQQSMSRLYTVDLPAVNKRSNGEETTTTAFQQFWTVPPRLIECDNCLVDFIAIVTSHGRIVITPGFPSEL